MKRLAILWLTLLGAFWLTRALVSALFFQRAVQGPGALFLLAAVPLAQALVVARLTRPGPGSPTPFPTNKDGKDNKDEKGRESLPFSLLSR